MSSSIKKNLKRFNIAHIHSVFLYPTYIGAMWCQEMGMPYIMDPFGALDPDMINFKSPLLKNIYISLIEKNNLEKSSCVNLTSDYEKNKFMKLNINVPIAIVPRAVNLSEYVQNKLDNSILKMYPELKGKKIILFLGRIHLKKGLDLLINAFKKVVSFDKDAYLLIAGPQEDNCVFKIKNMIKKYSLSEHVVFTGMMLGDNKLDILHMSDLFVLSSYGENFGLAVLEAMACSLPVVITDRVGLCKEVEANNAGFVTSCNSEKIAEAIITLLRNNNLRKEMGLNGRRVVGSYFTWDIVVEQMLSVYEKYRI